MSKESMKPAQQEPLTDIYLSFEQWKSGNVLEHGVPRTEYYGEAQLDLVEMGWKYGYDAGRAVEQALDREAENARKLELDYEPAQPQQEPAIWAISYDGKTPYSIWFEGDGALLDLEIKRLGGTACKMPLYAAPQPAQRTWVGLTDIEYDTICGRHSAMTDFDFLEDIEAKLKEKNT